MHLKSLTIKGFKSFASATTLDFEPGITCVVGPNGSGKSNVVDAIAWVMGEQGAKSLRGGKMDDVIFAGTSGRAPLGRAEVLLTIDNSDGALPVDYTEVTIARTLFRTGGSEYAINGTPCRLLDVQELLSDSGIGREMHVIVGQGRLDSILHATAEDRRGFIEEAAGVLKHRKRKEKALRKLDAMSANLTRLQDLTAELRRQLKPLGRQAEVARRAQVIQSDVRDARLRLLADDLLLLQGALQQEEADEAMLRERRGSLEKQLNDARDRESLVEGAINDEAPQLQRVNEIHLRLTALRERFAGLISLASERAKHLDEVELERGGPDPAELDRQADALAADAQKLASEIAALEGTLVNREAESTAADDELAKATALVTELEAARAKRREIHARLEGDLRTATSVVTARESELAGLAEQLAQSERRIAPLRTEVDRLTTSAQSEQESVAPVQRRHDEAVAARHDAHAVLEATRDKYQRASRDHAGVCARIDALTMSLKQGGPHSLDDAPVRLLGLVSDALRIDSGWETAVEAALAWTTDAQALAVADIADAVATLRHIRSGSNGRATLVIADEHFPNTAANRAPLSEGTWAATAISAAQVDGASRVAAAVQRVMGNVVLVDDLEAAARVIGSQSGVLAVTREGDVLSPTAASGGDAAAGRLHLIAEVESAETRARDLTSELPVLERELTEATEVFQGTRTRVKALAQEVAAVSAEASAQASELTVAKSRLASATDEADRLSAAELRARLGIDAEVQAVEVAQQRLNDHEQSQSQSEQVTLDGLPNLDELKAAVVLRRQQELDARLAVRSAQERKAAIETRERDLRINARTEREASQRAIEARAQRIARAKTAVRVLDVARAGAGLVEQALSQSNSRRLAGEQASQERNQELGGLRSAIRELAGHIAELTSDVHRDEIARAEQRLRVEQLEAKALEEHGVGLDELIVEYGPNVLVPPSAAAPGDEVDPEAPEPQPYPFVRSEQEKRLRLAEKSMALLGRVNPLALEEFAAMEERHVFLTTQLEDLKQSRRDLLDIVAEVDERVQQVFAEAFADVAREFSGVFERLFPGGEGRLVLTEPDDLLATGVEVEARPAGKRVKRLSLLSGGERSLTAVAFLVALFKARPSPFYLLDEVEAALDDVNLGRLIGLLEELRDTSQLLVITHQKRTMEIADSLYGVTMREGVTQVISQRMRELTPV
ncbi:MAG: chromosome segregation protein SMC [Candidatus Nanopelagicales bacterium]